MTGTKEKKLTPDEAGNILAAAAEKGKSQARKDLESVLNTITESKSEGFWKIQGKRTKDLIQEGKLLWSELENKVIEQDSKEIPKKVKNIAIEIAKNLGCYSYPGTEFSLEIQKTGPESYSVTAENIFENKRKEERKGHSKAWYVKDILEKHLTEINNNTIEDTETGELTDVITAYKTRLNTPWVNEYENSGLGYLDIASKAAKSFEFSFIPVGEPNLIKFIFKVDVSTVKKAVLQD